MIRKDFFVWFLQYVVNFLIKNMVCFNHTEAGLTV